MKTTRDCVDKFYAAIVERKGGEVESIPLQLIQFVDNKEWQV